MASADTEQTLSTIIAALDKLLAVQETHTERLDQLTTDVHLLAKAHQASNGDSGTVPVLDAGVRLTSVFELLEKILLALPMQDVFRAQSVNRNFRSVISKSKPLQKKLWLLPDDDLGDLTMPTINPLLAKRHVLERLPIYIDKNRKHLKYCFRVGRQHLAPRVPIVEKVRGAATSGRTMPSYQIKWTIEMPAKSSWYDDIQSANVLGAGSWRRMYLVQSARDSAVEVISGAYATQGVVKKGKVGTMDQLLEALAAVSLRGSFVQWQY